MSVSNDEIAVRSHDVVVTSGSSRATEFDALTNIGAAVRLAVNLRGVPPVSFDLLRAVAAHRLGILPSEVRPALQLLAEAEMVSLDQEGRTIKTIVPEIPYYEDLYTGVGEVGASNGLNEHEQISLEIMARLHQSPVAAETLVSLGAEKKALQRVLEIGQQAGFVLSRRARGRTIYLSPGYFSEDPQALADLTATSGSSRLSRVLELLRRNQGFPLKVIQERQELAGNTLDKHEIAILQALAGEGFVAPPAIETTFSGTNHFIFGPRPGSTRLMVHEVQIYRNALALVAAVRQGQFLAKEYAIRSPRALLNAFRDRGFLGSNSEATEQYRAVVQAGVAYFEQFSGGQAKLHLIDNRENRRTLDMAVELVSGDPFQPVPDEELILALRSGEQYVEPLLARKALSEYRLVGEDDETRSKIDEFFLRSAR